MSLTSWGRDPFSGNFFDDALDRAFSRFLGGDFPAPTTAGTPFRSLGGTGHPVDVVECKDKYCLKCDAPGFTPDEINVQLSDDGSALSICGHREEKQEQGEEGRFWRSERRFASFSRSFVLPNNAIRDHRAITAGLDKGILTIEVPKAAEPAQPEPKRITVQPKVPALAAAHEATE